MYKAFFCAPRDIIVISHKGKLSRENCFESQSAELVSF